MTKERARATAEESGIPLEHDKRCMCTDPTLHRLKWTNWKLVQAEQALKGKEREIEKAREYGAWWHDEALRLTEKTAGLTTRLAAAEGKLRAYRSLGDAQWIRDGLAERDTLKVERDAFQHENHRLLVDALTLRAIIEALKVMGAASPPGGQG